MERNGLFVNTRTETMLNTVGEMVNVPVGHIIDAESQQLFSIPFENSRQRSLFDHPTKPMVKGAWRLP